MARVLIALTAPVLAGAIAAAWIGHTVNGHALERTAGAAQPAEAILELAETTQPEPCRRATLIARSWAAQTRPCAALATGEAGAGRSPSRGRPIRPYISESEPSVTAWRTPSWPSVYDTGRRYGRRPECEAYASTYGYPSGYSYDYRYFGGPYGRRYYRYPYDRYTSAFGSLDPQFRLRSRFGR